MDRHTADVILRCSSPCRVGAPKTDASIRTIPLLQVVVAALAAHVAAHPPSDGFMFVNDDGRPIRRTAFGST